MRISQNRALNDWSSRLKPSGRRHKGFSAGLGRNLSDLVSSLLRKSAANANDIGVANANDIVNQSDNSQLDEADTTQSAAETAQPHEVQEKAFPTELPGATGAGQEEKRAEGTPRAQVAREAEAPRQPTSNQKAQETETHQQPTETPTPTIDLDSIDLNTLRIGSEAKATLSRFGIYTAQDLSYFRREELAELRHVTYVTLDVMEEGITKGLGKHFWIQGKRRSTKGRTLTKEEMNELDIPIDRLDVDAATKAMLRIGSFHTCRQLACVSKDALLDCPGIDLEKAFELEAALGKLLKKRVFTGCYVGEAPWIVEGEEPFPWRLDHKEARRDASAVSTVQNASLEPSINETAVQEPEATGEVSVPALETKPTVAEPAVADEAVAASLEPVATVQESAVSTQAEETESTQQAAVEAASNQTQQPVTSLSATEDISSDWDDGVFGWDEGYEWEEESEWDDPSKWDDSTQTDNEPDAPNSLVEQDDDSEYPSDSIMAWLSSTSDIHARVIECLLKGMTEGQAASKCGIPLSGVDSLTSYGLARRPSVSEDRFAPAFKKYRFDQASFSEAFNQPDWTYRYLELAYKRGTANPALMREEERVRCLTPSISPKVAVKGGKNRARALRKQDYARIAAMILRIADSDTEYSASFFYEALTPLRQELGLHDIKDFYDAAKTALSDRDDVTFTTGRIMRFGRCDRETQILRLLSELGRVTPGQLAQEYSTRYGVGKQTVSMWLMRMKQYQKGRYLDINYGSKPKAQKGGAATRGTSAKQRAGIPELSSITRSKIKTSILNLARWNTEYSTDYFFARQRALLRNVGVDDAQTFYLLAKDLFLENGGVTFPIVGRIIRFGSCDRDRQIEELLKTRYPIAVDDFVKSYSEAYGVDEESIYGWLTCINRYRHDGVFDLDYAGTDTAAPPTHQTTSALEPLRTDGAAESGKAENKELELALRIVDSAQWNREYSTDYFYKTFFSQARRFGVRDTHEFYALVKNALSEYKGIGFPEGPRLIRFGLCDRSEQMVGLLRELSPVEVDEYVTEYTVRYGVTPRTVREWLPHVSQYRRGNVLDMSAGAPSRPKSQKASSEQRLANAMLDLAQWGKEFSTDHFYENYPALVQVAGARDADDFYRLVKGCLSSRRDIAFPEGPHLIRFGTCSRTKQIIDLLNELSPVSVEGFTHEFKERYGIEERTVLAWTSCINRYRHDGVFDIAYKPDGVNREASQNASKTDVEATTHNSTVDASTTNGQANRTAAQPKSAQTAARSATPQRNKQKQLKTALAWSLSLTGQIRPIVQQTLFGNPLPRVARNVRLSTEETRQLLLDALASAPDVKEDQFALQYKASRSMREFCSKTKQPEMTYLYLSWKYQAMEEAGRSSVRSASTQNAQLDETVHKREAARAEARNPEQGMQRNNAPQAVSVGPKGKASTPYSTTQDEPKGRPSQEKVWSRLASEVDRIALWGKEYSVSYFYRNLRDLMKRYAINSETELYGILKQAYRKDPDVDFVDGGLIRFGRCDRAKQIRDLYASMHKANLQTVSLAYQSRYGVKPEVFAEWCDIYGIVISGKPDSKVSIEEHASATAKTRQATQSVKAAPPKLIPEHQQNETPKLHKNKPTSDAARYEAFLRSELNADCCDRRLIVERFRANFPAGPNDPFTPSMLQRLGYVSKGKKLLFRRGVEYGVYFDTLIRTHELFSRGDKGFENAVFNDPQFRQVLRRRMRDFTVVEYEKDSFISSKRLCKQMGVSLADIKDYARDVAGQLGPSVPFTIYSLTHTYNVHTPLDKLASEGGVSNYLFETLLDIDPHVQCCSLSGKRGFLVSEGPFTTANFLECLIEMRGPMEIDDLIDLFRSSYGIDFPELPLHHTISVSSLYYDDLTDSVFGSRAEWEEMVNRELA